MARSGLSSPRVENYTGSLTVLTRQGTKTSVGSHASVPLLMERTYSQEAQTGRSTFGTLANRPRSFNLDSWFTKDLSLLLLWLMPMRPCVPPHL